MFELIQAVGSSYFIESPAKRTEEIISSDITRDNAFFISYLRMIVFHIIRLHHSASGLEYFLVLD